MLIGTAGFAAAEVSISGNARMGIVDDGSAAGAVFNSRARVAFSLSGETDSGLSFGASFRADNAAASCTSPAITAGELGDAPAAAIQAGLDAEAAALAAGATVAEANDAQAAAEAAFVVYPGSSCGGGAVNGNAGSVTISGAFGSISMGDNDSAAQAAVGQVAGVGYTGNGDLNEIAYLGAGDSENVLYTYSAGAITVMASTSQTSDDNNSVAVSYAGEGFGVSLGVEDNGGADNHVVIGANTSMSGIALKAVYGSLGDLDQYAISATYSADALSVTAFTRSSFAEVQASGLGVGYDLGGGASFAAGYSKAENAEGRYDAGLNFSF